MTTTPLVVEQDGWNVVSHSAMTPEASEASIRETVRDTPAESPPPGEATPPAASAEPATASPAVEPPAETPPVEEPPTTEAKPKKETAAERVLRIRAEIAQATREKHDRLREAEAIKAEIDRLKRERESLGTTPGSSTDDLPPTGPTTPALSAAPTWKQFEEDGKSWDEYADARDAWNRQEMRRIVEAATQEDRARQQQARLEAQYEARLTHVIEQSPDFLDVVTQNLSDVPTTPFMRDVVQQHPKGAELLYDLGKQPEIAKALADLTTQATYAMMDAVMESADPRPLLFHFAQHREDFDRIRSLPPRSALVALGSLSTKLQMTGAKTGSPATPKPSSAPPPIQPVGGARTTGDVVKNLDDLPLEEYIRVKNAEDLRRGRRP